MTVSDRRLQPSREGIDAPVHPDGTSPCAAAMITIRTSRA
jgi:hypothetical protein